ncbi:putative 3-oxoacyl-[acyl-carrier-protein] synthase 3 [Bacteroidia bacterium]|nr:putative 3-oxoacyl-[acyl-carrier-protein] synthase 3 [Bacteroidia bacterium]
MSLKFTYHDKRIGGILTVLPQREVAFEEEMGNYNFSPAKSMKLKLAMGFNKHRIVDENTNVSDLAVFGINYLLDNNLIKKEDISALILVTQSPEYFLPATSNIIQGKADLGTDMLCMDINQGCAGFVIGLMQAYLLLDQPDIRKVLVINADVLSRKVSKRDRNSYPLVGDAACLTVVERSETPETIHAVVNMDGKSASAIQIPAGGFKIPCRPETAVMEEDKNGNFRSLENLVMKGDEVFNFVQTKVPPMIEELLKTTGKAANEIDYYFFHQPNKFMLNKLADKIGVPREKMPSNVVENFGNASGATIPTAVSLNLGDKALTHAYEVCFSGFGIGLTWAAIVQKLDKMKFNQIIYY